jgi:porphobilinogen synthase
VQSALRYTGERFPGIYRITDVCMCEYTSHGHCGVLDGGRVVNDRTLPYLARIAVSHAEAGADMVAPSDIAEGADIVMVKPARAYLDVIQRVREAV